MRAATRLHPSNTLRGGGIEAVACIKAIQEGWVPPTIGLDEADPECDLDYVPNQPREFDVDVCVNNAFGFGGHNASVIIKKFEG